MDSVESARAGRRSGATLKVELSNLRSRDSNCKIFVFEGDDDVPAYAAWIGAIAPSLNYSPLPGKGKGQVLDLRRRLLSDQTGLSRDVYYFVDKDYDGLRGQNPGGDVFCTDTYSIENCFVTHPVLNSLLVEDFGMAPHSSDFQRAKTLFISFLSGMAGASKSVNLRIFVGVRLGVLQSNIDFRAREFVDVRLDGVDFLLTEDRLNDLVQLGQSPSSVPELMDEFELLDPSSAYRGKFLLQGFLRWLECLADVMRSKTDGWNQEGSSVKFARNALTPRNLASRSDPPVGLSDFLGV